MKKLWNLVNGLEVKNTVKSRYFLLIMIVSNMIIGAAIYIIFGRIIWPGIDYLLCFIGYPAFFVGFICGVIYLYNHGFV